MNSPNDPLEFYLEGKKDSKTLIIFMQGWPDSNQVWEPLDWKTTLADSRLLFINFPNTSKTQQEIRWGQDFPVIIQRIKATLDKIQAEKFDKKIIVAHDWGCHYTYLFDQTFPGYVNELITLDVPGIVQIKGVLPKLMVLVYQLTLIFAFVFGGWPGKMVTQGVSKFFKYVPAHFGQINSSRNYPYFYFYKNIFASLFNKSNRFLYRYKPSVPVVYIYGKKKPFLFHGEKWENYIKQNDKCEIHSFDTGHWIMNRYGPAITDIIIRRIKSL